MPIKPARPYRALASVVGAIVILAVVGLWAHGEWTGESLGALWQLVVLAIVIGGAYRVFGKRTMDDALETAQDLQGSDTEDNDGGN
jgi:flagellar motor component MotA